MTIRYAGEFATNSSLLGCFTKLLFRWRGSVYKIVWKEYIVFLLLFFCISLIYRFALTESGQLYFEKIANFCEKSEEAFRLYFILGFFVTSIVSKWWKLFESIPYPDSIAHYVYASIRGQDDGTKLLRKTIVRYCCLCLMLTFLTVSPPLKRRYPTHDHLIKEGLLTEEEKVRLEKIQKKTKHSITILWFPITWVTDLLAKAVNEDKIHPSACSRIFDQLDRFRHGCIVLMQYEHNTVPLAYIQVVTISVYAYFFSCLFGRQWLMRNEKLMNLDLYFPFLTTLEFIFYMGWMRVAESMINPFGCDDDDFELQEIIQRNILITESMVSATDDDSYSKPVENGHHHNHDDDDSQNPITVTHLVNEMLPK